MAPTPNKFNSPIELTRRQFVRTAAGGIASIAVAANAVHSAQPARSLPDKLGRILLKGGVVLTFDAASGDFEKADVLIEGKKIIAVRPNISATAMIIDASNMIVLPGFIDSHHHCYQGALRNIQTNGLLDDYSRDIVGEATPFYRPEDAYEASSSVPCVPSMPASRR